MKRNLLNFTRGSQLLGHFGFMFAAGLKGPLLVTLGNRPCLRRRLAFICRQLRSLAGDADPARVLCGE